MPLSSPLSPLTIPLRRHPRLILALLTLITFLLLISLLAPDPTSPSFQWPGLLPSRYPPSSHPHNPILSQRLSTASDLLSQMCSSHGPLEPIYIDPGLTRAQERRYDHLRHTPIGNNNNANDPNHEKRILIVSTIRQIHNQLPDLLNTLVVLVTFLGGPRLAFSFLEGPSDDCTSEAFEAVVGPTLLSMGIPHHHLHLVTRENQIDFGKGNRMQILADLRNRALSPLWSDAIGEKHGGKDVEAVVMLNDVFLRARDILELLHQHSITAAGITTGWDWWQRRPGNYYDVWVGRTLDTGDLFYPITGTSWSPSTDLFPGSLSSGAAFDELKPFQVYSSWNGMAVLDPAPFLPPHNVRFRKGDAGKGECTASECTIIAQDFWAVGRGKIQIVPSVQLAYEVQSARETRDDLDSAQRLSSWADGVPPSWLDTHVEWSSQPPKAVRCHPWPEQNGKDANVWAHTLWVDPYTGMPL